MVQPPLLASKNPEIGIASNDEWLSVTPVYDGNWRVAYIKPSEGGNALYGDESHFPQIEPFWIGAKFTGSIHFPSGVKVCAK